MFTWQELLDMGIRQRGYWMRQADAIKRQNIASMAHAVGIAMTDKDSRRDALDALELTQTAKESKKQLSDSWWGLTKLFRKRGRGV